MEDKVKERKTQKMEQNRKEEEELFTQNVAANLWK